MYNAFSVNYDRFVNWQERLAFELPFLESQLQSLVQDGELVAQRLGLTTTDVEKFFGLYERRAQYAAYLTEMITPE